MSIQTKRAKGYAQVSIDRACCDPSRPAAVMMANTRHTDSPNPSAQPACPIITATRADPANAASVPTRLTPPEVP